MATKKNYKYSAQVKETFSYGRFTSTEADSLTEVRKKILKNVRSMNWHKTGSEPVGFCYVNGMVTNYLGGKQWGIKDQIAYLSYDKKANLLWWNPRKNNMGNGETRLVKPDGTLGMTRTAYYNKLNKLNGWN